MVEFRTKMFTELTLDELYRIMQLRQEVFVVEQDCPYLDADDKDQQSLHTIGYNNKKEVVAYCRLVPPGLSYHNYASIGRVATSLGVRKMGVGKKMMIYAIEVLQNQYSHSSIKISAQKYLEQFYKGFGFMPTGEEYLEDGIPHMGMVL